MNPVEAGFVERPEDYLYSSAKNFNESKGLLNLEPLEMKKEWNFHQGSQETSTTYYPQDTLRLPVGRQGSLAGAVSIFTTLTAPLPLLLCKVPNLPCPPCSRILVTHPTTSPMR
jgi:hypothetical protein